MLVDDELSTGRTALNTITALHRLAPREHYVVAALVDVRPRRVGAGRRRCAALGARLDVVALARGRVELPPDLAERAAALDAPLRSRSARLQRSQNRDVGAAPQGRGERVELAALGWPRGVPVGGRHGFRAADHTRAGRGAARAAPRRLGRCVPRSAPWCWAPRS